MTFDDFSAIFKHSSEFPLEARDRVPADLWNAIDGDLVLLDFARKDKKLYHVKDNNFDDYALIENAPEVLDRYFANAIRGFPEPFDFRRS